MNLKKKEIFLCHLCIYFRVHLLHCNRAQVKV